MDRALRLMEIEAMWFWGTELLGYLRTRMPVAVFFPAAIFLNVAALAAGRSFEPAGFLWSTGLALLLLLQFRLWDDLVDVHRDRHAHPSRLLCRAESLTGFRLFLGVLFLVNGFWISRLEGILPLLVFCLYCVLLGLWYRLRPSRSAGHDYEYHVVLTKYPLFVYLLSCNFCAANLRLLLSLLLVYFCLGVYELLHDRRLRRLPSSRALVGIEMSVLVGVSLLMTLLFLGPFTPVLTILGTLWCFWAAAAAWFFIQYDTRTKTGPQTCTLFLLGFFQLLTFSLGGTS